MRRITFLLILLSASAVASPPAGVSYWSGPWVLTSDAEMGDYWAAPKGTVGLIDLRPLTPTDHDGFFAVVGEDETVALEKSGEYLLLGRDLYGEPAGGAMEAWEARLGLARGALESRTLIGCLAEILTEDADGTGQRAALPLIPGVDGQLEIHLGGHSLVWSRQFEGERDKAWPQVQRVIQRNYAAVRVEAKAEAAAIRKTAKGKPKAERDKAEAVAAKAETLHSRYLSTQAEKLGVPWEELIPAGLPKEEPTKPSTTYSDDFNRANGALGANWTVVNGTVTVSSNAALSAVGTGTGLVSHNGDLSSDDMHVSLTRGALTADADYAAATARINGYTGYIAVYRATANNLYKRTAISGYTLLQAITAVPRASSATVATQADGSSISAWLNGVQDGAAVTDTTYSGVLRGGAECRNTNAVAFDNWQAFDLSATIIPQVQYYNRLLRGAWLRESFPAVQYLASIGGSLN